MAKKKNIEVPTDIDMPVVVNGGVNAETLVEEMVKQTETDPAVLNPYNAELNWHSCQIINHSGILYNFPQCWIELDGTMYPPDTVLITMPTQERIYALPKVTFEFLFGKKR